MSSSSARNGNVPSRSSRLDRVEAREQRVAVVVGDDPARREHARVRARLRDVVGPQAPVEAERRVQRAGTPGPGGSREARHRRRREPYAALRPSAIWADLGGEARSRAGRGVTPQPAPGAACRGAVEAPVAGRASRSTATGTKHSRPRRHEHPRRPARDEVAAASRRNSPAMSAIDAVPEHDRAAPAATSEADRADTAARRRRRARSASARTARHGPIMDPGRPASASASATRCDLALGHRREERQRDRARGDVLADRELALAVAEALAVEAHEVDRRQVGLGLHAALAQRADRPSSRSRAARHLDDEDEPAAARRRRRPRTAARGPRCPASASR